MNRHELIKFLNDNEISLGMSAGYSEVRYINDQMGYGRFANRDIDEDEVIYRTGGFWMTTKERNYYKEDFFNYVEDADAWLFQGGLKSQLNGSHNHSCEPNAYFQENIIRALKPIRKDEEITLDYATFVDHSTIIIENCMCGKDSCRGTIHGQDWWNLKLPIKYDFKVNGNVLTKFLLRSKEIRIR